MDKFGEKIKIIFENISNRYRGHNGEKGTSLIEILVSVGLLSLLGVSFLVALNIITNAVVKTDGEATAEALAKAEIEYINTVSYKNATWSYQLPGTPPSWDTEHALPQGYASYTLSTNATSLSGQGNDIQQITVTVTRGTQSSPWQYVNFTVTDYKVNR